MEIKEIKKELMQETKKLSDVTLEVSKLKAAIANLKEEKDTFIALQNDLAKAEIKKVLEESKDILEQIQSNTTESTTLFNQVKTFCVYIEESYENLEGLNSQFEELKTNFDAYILNEEEKLGKRKNELNKQASELVLERKKLKKFEKSLDDKNKRIESQRAALNVAIKEYKLKI